MIRKLIVISLLAVVALIGLSGAAHPPVNASPLIAPSPACEVISCTVYLPLILKPVPLLVPQFEVTQGIQQPDNSVRLIAQRPTYVRWSLASPGSETNVSAYLVATRNGATLAGSPLAAVNNPRVLKYTVTRSRLGDTFNFPLPVDWADGTVNLSAYAVNTTGFIITTFDQAVTFSASSAMAVKAVPIEYHCTNGGNDTTPIGPYDYLIDYTFRTYPVPAITLSTHSVVRYVGPCNTSGVPLPWSNSDPNNFSTWENMLDAVTSVWQAEGSPNIYYYGLLHLDCGGSCVAGIGWIGLQAAVGFDGFGAAHSGASDTHAHEVGHNHGRNHAPGCGAGGAVAFPYLDGNGRATIGNAAHPNYGFDLNSQQIYRYDDTFDIMSYCDPVWVSDFTYEAWWQYDNVTLAARSTTALGDRSFLISGSIDPGTSRVDFRPTYALNLPARLPDRGEYVLELIDARSRVIAAYPFAAVTALPDRPDAAPTTSIKGFHLTVPYIEGVSALRVRRGSAILGTQLASRTAPSLNAAQVRSGQLSWSGVAGARYLVRASIDNGRTWEVIGLDLLQPSVNLDSARFGGRRTRFEIVASNGLNSRTLTIGPVFVPDK